MNMRQPAHRNCRGTSTLEFIVVLPFLFIVMLTAVELSRMMFTYNTIVQATRDGARVGVVTPLSGTSFNSGPAIARINAILGASNLTASSENVFCDTPSPCAPDSKVTATVTVNFQTWVPLISSMFPSVSLTHSSYMRYE